MPAAGSRVVCVGVQDVLRRGRQQLRKVHAREVARRRQVALLLRPARLLGLEALLAAAVGQVMLAHHAAVGEECGVEHAHHHL